MLEELLETHDVGGAGRRDQFAIGPPLLGQFAGPGVCPVSSKIPEPISRGKLFQSASPTFKPERGGVEAYVSKLRKVTKGWRHGPHRYTPQGELISEGKDTVVNPAYPLGVQQSDKFRAADDLRRSLTNEATPTQTPTSLPSWGHLAQMCALFVSEGALQPLSSAKADHADTYKQLPLLEEGELAVVVTLKNLSDGFWFGFVSRARRFGSTAAALNYNCLSTAIASPICRFPKILRVGSFEDFGIAKPGALAKAALCVFTRFDDALIAELKRRKSEARSFFEFRGLAVSFRDDGRDVGASLSFSKEKTKKLVESGVAAECSRNSITSCAAETCRQCMYRPNSFHG